MLKSELIISQDTLIIETDGGRREISIYSEEGFKVLARLWLKSAWERKISYEVTWLGIPIIQLPEDILMMQELIYKVRPDVIVETGTAHGGSAIFYASLLELLGKGQVISVDKEIRTYNRLAIQSHPMSKRITLIQGSSVEDQILDQIRSLVQPQATVLVVLDSNHAYAHVREELEKYSKLVTAGSYLIVFDGVMELLADAPNGSSTWVMDNPIRAVEDFLAAHTEFEVDSYYNRLELTYCPNGFLKRKAG
jgi:cephalosporin hydroxylase